MICCPVAVNNELEPNIGQRICSKIKISRGSRNYGYMSSQFDFSSILIEEEVYDKVSK